MLTEHYLFCALGVTSISRVKFVDSKGISSSPPPDSLLLTVLRR